MITGMLGISYPYYQGCRAISVLQILSDCLGAGAHVQLLVNVGNNNNYAYYLYF